MPNAYVSAVIHAPIQDVWTILRDFGSVKKYYSRIASCEIAHGVYGDRVGCIRSASLADGRGVSERLVSFSDRDHSMTYEALPGHSFPNNFYRATVHLLPVTDGDQTFIEWHSEYDVTTGDPDEVRKFIEENIYMECIEGLKNLLADS
jgi:hypothetical protein